MPEKIIIGISVEKKIAKADENAVIVCGNSNYKAVFAFDSEWDDYPVKTAIFATDNTDDNKPIAVVFNGNECDIPPMANTTIVGVGVCSGDLTVSDQVEVSTTTPAYIPCLISIKDLGDAIAPPAPDVYDQIIALLNKYIQQGGGGGSGGTDEERVREIVAEEISDLQPKADESLPTESKEIVGAIKELYEREDKQGLSREQVEGIVDDKISTEIPAWAKEPTKPSYTAEEVGALPSDTPMFSGDYNDLTNKPEIPSMEGVATEEYVDEKIGSIETALDSIIAIQNSLIGGGEI